MLKGPAEYYHDPVGFLVDVLDMAPDPWQAETVKDIDTHPKVAVKSGQGVGKTALEAGLAIWFLCCRPYAKVVCTAPTMQQLYDVLWAEIAKWLTRSKVRELLTWTKTKVYMNGDAERWFATAKTATKPENMQGFHEDHMLIIVDEASGVADPIMEAILGTLTGKDNRLLLMGNPNRIEGVFYDAFGRDRDQYRTRTVSSRESSRTSRENIEMLERKYGIDSDVVRVRIDGNFPRGGLDAFIPLEMAEIVSDRQADPDPNDPVLHVGADIARFGDDKSVIARRVGGIVLPLQKFTKQSTMETAGRIIRVCKDHLEHFQAMHKAGAYCRVRIDDSGVGGGVTDRLREIVMEEQLPIEVIAVNNGASASDTHYANLGTQLWGNLRELLERSFSAVMRAEDPEIILPKDDELIKQLSVRKYHINSKGRIELERKEDMKKRGIGSPDCADAVSLCLYEPAVATLQTFKL